MYREIYLQKLIMKNFVVMISLCFFLPFNSCKNDCEADKIFYDLYQNSLQTLKQAYKEGLINDHEEYLRRPTFFLVTISGHSSSRVAGHFGIIYHNTHEYEMDMLSWENWLAVNKCNYTMQKADSLFLLLDQRYTLEGSGWEEYLK